MHYYAVETKWTVPATGTYWIEANGAMGGSNKGRYGNIVYRGGKGAKIKGKFDLSAGTLLYILVGEQGCDGSDDRNRGGGGGGGTFVVSWSRDGYKILVIAGGGGSSGADYGGQGAAGAEADGLARGNAGKNGQAAGSYSGWPRAAPPIGTAGASDGASAKKAGECSGGKGWNDILNQSSGSWSPMYNCALGSGKSGCGAGGGGYSGGGAYSTQASGGGGGSYNAGYETTNTTGGNSRYEAPSLRFGKPCMGCNGYVVMEMVGCS